MTAIDCLTVLTLQVIEHHDCNMDDSVLNASEKQSGLLSVQYYQPFKMGLLLVLWGGETLQVIWCFCEPLPNKKQTNNKTHLMKEMAVLLFKMEDNWIFERGQLPHVSMLCKFSAISQRKLTWQVSLLQTLMKMKSPPQELLIFTSLEGEQNPVNI